MTIRFRQGKTFYRIFLPILVLGVALASGLGSYIYMTTTHSVIDRLAAGKLSFVSQSKNTLEQSIRTIEYAFTTYSTTSSFREAVSQPISEQSFQEFRSVNSQLNYIATMGMDGAEYTLISLQQRWQIASGKLTQLSDEELRRLQDDYIGGRRTGLFWTPTQDGLRLVHTLPAFSIAKTAVALSDLPKASLDRMLATREDSPVLILNSEGTPLYEPRPLGLDAAAVRLLAGEAAKGTSGVVTLTDSSGRRTQAAYVRSDYNSWVYATPLRPQETAQALRPALYGLILMGALIAGLIVVVAYFIAYYFANSIRRIQVRLPSAAGAQAAGAPAKDEIDWIVRSIDHLLVEKQGLESLLETELPKLETQLLLNLFRGRMEADELAHQLRRFGYRLSPECRYAVMLIQLDSYGSRGAADKDMLLLAASRLVEELVPRERRLLPIVLNEGTQATVFTFDGWTDEEIQRCLQQAAKQAIVGARERLGVSISVGFSRIYRDLAGGSREAVEMGKQALHQRLHLGKESIIFYEDVAEVVSGPVLLRYPAQLENILFDAIRLGDEQAAAAALYPFLAEWMKTSKNSTDFEVMLVRFVHDLIQLEQLLGIQVLLAPDNESLYQRVLQIRNPEEIERILMEGAVLPMARSMKQKTNEQFRSLSDRIAAIVRSEYDRELSLESIADRLHYNPNYLSSIFRKEYGITFSEFLMNYRLETAKKWLAETELPVKEIAERLQYQNPQNFIRSFRKKENMTPGAYRKERRGA